MKTNCCLSPLIQGDVELGGDGKAPILENEIMLHARFDVLSPRISEYSNAAQDVGGENWLVSVQQQVIIQRDLKVYFPDS